MNMLLMGKKKKEGDLGHVWIAAHFPKRINKQIAQHTNITSSVDRILVDQLPNVTYRILGFLLLGVARIYSKKVEYLLIDCNHSLNEMKHFSERKSKVDINFGGMCVPESSSHRSKGNNAAEVPVAESSSKKKCNNFVEAMRTQFSSIILPENFELDAFDLEIVENDSSNDHVRPHLELVLNDARENDRTRYPTFGKEHWDLPARFSDLASTSTSTMITNINLETSAEKFRDRFALDECMDPMVLSESDDDVDHVVIPIIEQGPESNNINASDMISEDREHPDNIENDKDPDEECITGQTVVSETTPADNIMMKPSPDKSQLSVTINVTPQSKVPVVLDNHKSDFEAIRTPASREYVRGSRKRKCVFDDSIVIPNKEYKQWLLNASDLVRKRRGSIAILASKKQQSFDCFTQPIIPSFPSDIRSVISKNDLVLTEQEQKQVEHTTPQDLKVDDVGPLDVLEVHEERDEGIAPSTPVSQATSVRFSEIHETSKVNQAEPASSYESEEREHSHIRDVEWNKNEMEKGQSSLGVNQENVLTAEKWSAVTKSVGGYLHSNFVRREEKGEAEAVKVTEILKQKTKKESARFFYQILVLKTGGYIDVKQEKPYDEISVIQTPKLNEVFGKE